MKHSTRLLVGITLTATLLGQAHATAGVSTNTPVPGSDMKTDVFTITATRTKPYDNLTYDTVLVNNDKGWTTTTDADIGYVRLHYQADTTADTYSYVDTVSSKELAAVGCVDPYGTITTLATANTSTATGVKIGSDAGGGNQDAYLHIMKGKCTLPDGLYNITITVKSYTK